MFATKTRNLTIGSLLLLISFGTKAQVCTPAPNGLISWWTGDGNGLDPRSRNNGTLQNGATFSAGFDGQAFSFDGVNDFFEVPDSPSLEPQQLTLEAWVFPTSDAAGGAPDSLSMIVAKEDALVDQYEIGRKNNTACGSGNGIPTGNFSFYIEGLTGLPNDCSAFVNGNASLPLNTWSHVALTYNGSNVNAYVNGVLTRTIAATGTIPNTNGSLRIGGRANGTTSFWAGQIDEVSLYDRALSFSQIQAIFNAGSAGKCKPVATIPPTGIAAWWPGDGNANDISGNNNNGVLFGNAGFAIGKVGQAFSLPSNSYVEAPDSASLSITGQLSIEFWIDPNDLLSNQTIVSKYNTACPSFGTEQRSYALDLRTGGQLQFCVYNGLPDQYHCVETTNLITAGTFNHVAGTFNPATQDMRIYVNGVNTAATVQAGSVDVTSIFDSNTPVDIGRVFCATATNAFTGLIDETTLYNRVLTPDEITSIFNAGSAGKQKPLAPTAAHVSVSGRVTDMNGNGLSRTAVAITGADGLMRTTSTNAFGYYEISGVESGQTYVVAVKHKGYTFAPRAVNVGDDLLDLDFIALTGSP